VDKGHRYRVSGHPYHIPSPRVSSKKFIARRIVLDPTVVESGQETYRTSNIAIPFHATFDGFDTRTSK
jgi:hypothetical protein